MRGKKKDAKYCNVNCRNKDGYHRRKEAKKMDEGGEVGGKKAKVPPTTEPLIEKMWGLAWMHGFGFDKGNALVLNSTVKHFPHRNNYALVIGKPPRDKYRDFIDKGMNALRPGGLLIYAVPNTFLSSADSGFKNQLAEKAELVDAYRLHWSTDIIVLKKA
ncbi:hypothetical protein JYU20_00635 [Bacteroidales bacterium AH-315-I05]|nr:hypothetical protein [Bacteroidales bacterium AH-315-I05]